MELQETSFLVTFSHTLLQMHQRSLAKVNYHIMTKHADLLIIRVTDKGTAFISTIIAEVLQILGNALMEFRTSTCVAQDYPQYCML